MADVQQVVDMQDSPDAEIEEMKQRVKEMEQEAEKLRAMQAQAEKDTLIEDNKDEVDSRSIYIGNVDYSSSPEEIQAHFQSCGTINRVTILCDKWTGNPKGFAYVEFADPSLVANAVMLDNSTFKGRPIKVTAKRTNVFGFNRGRGRGSRGRGAFRGRRPSYRGRRGYYAPY